MQMLTLEGVKLLRGLNQRTVGAGACTGGSFVQFGGGAVGEAQHNVAEVFVELRLPGEYLQAVAFRRRGRREMQMAGAAEDCAGNLAVDLAVEDKLTAREGEGSRVALEHQVLNRDS